MSAVQLSEISLRFGSDEVLRGIDLTIPENQYVVILGASGCGKTSLLRIIAGLIRPTAGEVRIAGKCVNEVAPRLRHVALVPQQAGLYPHLPIGKSIGLGIHDKVSAAERRSRVQHAARIVDMDSLLDRLPQQLSGGQLRRAAVAKAIANRASVRLLDEPLSAIDANLRYQIQEDLSRLHQETPGVTIHVTHDGAEARRLADRLAVIEDGKIIQFGSPDSVRARPATPTVAASLGDSRLITVSVQKTAEGWRSETGLMVQGPEAAEGSGAVLGYFEADRIPLAGVTPQPQNLADEQMGTVVRSEKLLWFLDRPDESSSK